MAAGDGGDLSLRGLGAALSAFYAAKIAAVRRDVSPADRAALLRVLEGERQAAFRTLADRRQAVTVAARERRATARFSDREARRRARAPPLPL